MPAVMENRGPRSTVPAEMLAGDRDALHHQTLREARATARLTHPAVAGVYDAFEVDGESRKDLAEAAASLRARISKAEGPKRAAVLAALDRLEKRFGGSGR